jgi:hypothetical protein
MHCPKNIRVASLMTGASNAPFTKKYLKVSSFDQ